ncbi:MAG: DNA repair protein [Chloroflexi bacterium 44-23]|nr:MAG: DNA repair protein [Chloroflexi bacterium 44-23]
MDRLIYTIGHSTHPIDEFIRILKTFGIEEVVDVRTIPKSRHNPQFNEEELCDQLGNQGIEYVHLDKLGGLRHTTKESVNTAWKNASFRGFADYMQTPEFTKGLEELIDLAQEKQVAIMCAEAVPWRCHRSLIGDALLARNISVEDIFNEKSSKPHHLTPFANVNGDKITYPGPPELI